MRSWLFEDCLLLADPGRRAVHALNPSGSFLWELLESGMSEGQAALEFAALYDISPETASADVLAALDSWRSQGLLEPEAVYTPDASIATESEFASTTRTLRQYSIASTSFTVSVSNDDLLHAIERRLEPFRCDHLMQPDPTFAFVASRDATVIVMKGGTEVARDEAGAVPTILAGEILKLFFPDATCDASLHAAAVGAQDRCVLFAGASGSGKSTLSASLSQRGFDLLTDDVVWLESSTLDVLTVPFAVKLRQGSWPVLQNEYPEIASLPVHLDYGERVKYLQPTQRFVKRTKAAAFVFVHFDSAHAASLRPMDAFQSLAGLQNSGFWVEHECATVQSFLHWFENIPRFDLAWSDADAVAALMPQLLNSAGYLSKV